MFPNAAIEEVRQDNPRMTFFDPSDAHLVFHAYTDQEACVIYILLLKVKVHIIVKPCLESLTMKGYHHTLPSNHMMGI